MPAILAYSRFPHWGNIRIVLGLGMRVQGFGFMLGLYGENERENSNYYLGFRVILGLYGDTGKYHGNYYSGFRVILSYMWMMEKKTDSKGLGLYWGYIGIMVETTITTYIEFI